MANVTITRGKTLPDSSAKSDFHELVDLASANVSNIVNADIDAAAGIVDTKLAALTTASKVSGSALYNMASLATTAGIIPPINFPHTVVLKVIDDTDSLNTGDGQMYFTVPDELSGMDLKTAAMAVYAKSTSGSPTIQLARGRRASATHNASFNDILNVPLAIDVNEFDSINCTTAASFNASYIGMLSADILRVDVDTAGTGTQGLEVRLKFSK